MRNKKSLLFLVTILVLICALSACSSKGGSSSLKLADSVVTLELGAEYTIAFAEDVSVPKTEDLVITSSDTTVVSVSGLTVSAVGGGTATISVKYGEKAAASLAVIVNKATPTITTPPTVDTTVQYSVGDRLPTLSGGVASVEGTFSWTSVQSSLSAGTVAYTYVFTPTNTQSYNTVNGTIEITTGASEARVFYDAPTVSLTYGDSLPAMDLKSGSTPGTLALDAGQTLSAGTHDYNWTFTPNDTNRFATKTGVVSLTVAKATPSADDVVVGYSGTLRVGDDLPALTVSEEGLAGTAELDDGQVLILGSNSYDYTFYPEDEDNYNSASFTITIEVLTGYASVSVVPYVSPLTYGDALPTLSLQEGSTAGTVVLDAGQVLLAGRFEYNWTFTPDDTEAYATTTGKILLSVSQATPIVEVVCTQYVSFLDAELPPLVSSGIDGHAELDVGQSLVLGSKVYSWTFYPTDSDNYRNTTGTIEIVCGKVRYVAEDIPQHDVISGTYSPTTRLSAYTLSSGFYWVNPTTIPTVDVTEYEAYYNAVPSNYDNYPVTLTLNLAKANPEVTSEPTFEGTYAFDTPLSSINLIAGTSLVAGTYAWTTPTQTISIGQANYSYTFTPNDTVNYNAYTGTISVTGARKRPVLSAAPTISSGTLYYGDTIPQLSGGTADVEGEFRWYGSTTLTVGTSSYSWKFYPTDTERYNELLVGNISITVEKAESVVSGVTYTGGQLKYGNSLPELTLGSGSTPGKVELDSTQILFVGTNDYRWVFTPTNSNYSSESGMIELTVEKGDYSGITHSVISGVYSGRTLSEDFRLVTGYSWASEVANTIPNAGTHSFAAYYNRDALNYNNFELQITVTIDKAMAVESQHQTVNYTYADNKTLADVTLPSGYSWYTSSTPLTVAASGEVDVVYNPNPVNYRSLNTTVSLIVAKADYENITYTGTFASEYVYSPSRLLAHIPLVDDYSWANRGEVPSAAKSQYAVVYNADSANYNDFNFNVSLNVIKATPNVYIAPALSFYASLADITEMPTFSTTARTSVAGSFEWISTVADITLIGENTVSYRFVPTDDANYNSITLTTSIWESKKPVTISVEPTVATADYVYGDAMPILSGGSALGDDLPITGSFTWLATVPKLYAGEIAYAWRFTPNDSDFASYIGYITISVAKADYRIEDVPSHADITGVYSPTTSLGDIPLDNGYRWKNSSLIPPAGRTAYSVYYNADPDNYNDFEKVLYVELEKADMTGITHEGFSGASYVYSPTKDLSRYELNYGTYTGFSWQDSSVIPTVDVKYYAAIYQLNSNYNPLYIRVLIDLTKASYTDIDYDELSGVYAADRPLSYYVLTNGFYWSEPTTIPTVAISEYSAYYTLDTVNYNSYQFNITLNISQGTPVQVKPVSASSEGLVTGSSMPALNGLFDVEGTLSWDNPNIRLSRGDTAHAWTFTPDDSDNYSIVHGQIILSVGKGTPVISVNPSLQLTLSGGNYSMPYQPELPTLVAGSASIDGTFSWVSGQTVTVGAVEYQWQFVPTSSSLYNTVTGSILIDVSKADPVVNYSTAGLPVLHYGDAMPSMTVQSGSTDGTLAWQAGQSLTTGTSNYQLVFTPTRSELYNSKTFTVELTVQKATPVAIVSPYYQANDLYYGDSLPLLLGRYNTEGVIAWSDARTFCATGTFDYEFTFTPTDTTNYSSCVGALSITAAKAVAVISTAPTAATNTIKYSSTVQLPALVGGSATRPQDNMQLEGVFEWLSGQTILAGTINFEWRFVPNDTDNFVGRTGAITIVIEKGDYVGIQHRDLSASYSLTKTVAQHFVLDEYFRYNESASTLSAIPTVNTYVYNLYYNADSANYNDFALTVNCEITKGNLYFSCDFDVTEYGLIEDYPMPQHINPICLLDSDSVQYTFQWAKSVLEYGSVEYSYSVIPNDTTNINTYAGTASFDSAIAYFIFTPILDVGNTIGYSITPKRDNLSGVITLPEHHYDDLPVLTIADNAFKNDSDITSVVMSSHITTIGVSSFEGMTVLVSVDVNTAIVEIGNAAFRGCVQLSAITVPATATTLGTEIFKGCIQLSTVTYQSTADLTSQMFANCSMLSTLSTSVNAFTADTFSGCVSLRVLTVGTVAIPASALRGLTSLRAFNATSITSVGNTAFEGCIALSSIPLGDATSIGEAAFKGCIALESADLSSAETLGVSVFEGCLALTTISLCEDLTVIPQKAFFNCGISDVLHLPEGITSIGTRAFAHMVNESGDEYEKSVSLKRLVSDFAYLETIGSEAFRGNSGLTYIGYCTTTIVEGEPVVSYPFVSGLQLQRAVNLTSIGANAFYDCWLDEVDLPAEYTVIEPSILANAGVHTFRLNDSVTEIQTDALIDNAYLIGFIIGQSSSLTTIAPGFMEGCATIQTNPVVQIFIPNGLTLGAGIYLGFTRYVLHTPQADGATDECTRIEWLSFEDYCYDQHKYDIDPPTATEIKDQQDQAYATYLQEWAEWNALSEEEKEEVSEPTYPNDISEYKYHGNYVEIHFECPHLSDTFALECGEYSCLIADVDVKDHEHMFSSLCGCLYFACQSEPNHGANLIVYTEGANTTSLVEGVARWTCGCLACYHEVSDGSGGTTQVTCPNAFSTPHELLSSPCPKCGDTVCARHIVTMACGCTMYACIDTMESHTQMYCYDCRNTHYTCQLDHCDYCNEDFCPVSTNGTTAFEAHKVIYCTECGDKCCPSVQSSTTHVISNICGCSSGYSCQSFVPAAAHEQITFDCGDYDYSCHVALHESTLLVCGHTDYKCKENGVSHTPTTLACGCIKYECGGSNSVETAHAFVSSSECCSDECTGMYECQVKYHECGCAYHTLPDGSSCPYDTSVTHPQGYFCYCSRTYDYSCQFELLACGHLVCDRCKDEHDCSGE